MPIAVAAGFVSFISPCVLPLLPGYLAFLSGATGSLEGRAGRGRAVIGSIAFIIGFAIVFVSLGALFGGFGALLKDHQRLLSIVFGVGDDPAWDCSSAGGGPRRGSIESDESTICRGPRSSARARWDSSSRSAGRRASVRRSRDPWARRRHPARPHCADRSSRSSTASVSASPSSSRRWRPSG